MSLFSRWRKIASRAPDAEDAAPETRDTAAAGETAAGNGVESTTAEAESHRSSLERDEKDRANPRSDDGSHAEEFVASVCEDLRQLQPEKRKSGGSTKESAEPVNDQVTTAADEKDEKDENERSGGGNDNSNNAEKSQEGSEDSKEDAGDGEEDDDPSKYPRGAALALLTFGLCMCTFVVALDNTIIATAIPKITTQFRSLTDVGWYGSAYLLTTTSLQPFFGKVYTYFSIKWTYISAIALFEVGSIICAAAQSSVMFIIGRAIAGAGASALFSGGMTIIGFAVPLSKRAIYIAALSSMFGISSVIGPILGGVLTDRASWRWCFWINLPFGGAALLAVMIFFKPPKRDLNNMTLKEKIKDMDILGAVLLICAVVCLLLALQWGGITYPWKDSKVWGTLLGFGLIIIAFSYLQWQRQDRATLPPRILRQRTILASALFNAFLSMGLYTLIYYLPFYFQAVKGTSAEGSGIRTIALLVSLTVASVVIGGLITVLGWYVPFMWAGSAVYVVGCGLLYTLKVNSGTGTWIGYQIVTGIGSGASVQIPFIAVQVVLGKKDMPTGNAIAVFFNTLGGAIAISIAQNIFANTLKQQIPNLVHGLDPNIIINAGATHVRDVVSAAQLPGVLEAYNRAVTSAFILGIAAGGVAFLSSLAMEWKSVKGKKIEMGAAA